MKLFIKSILITSLLLISCSDFLMDEYEDINYFTPKFIPNSNSIYVLKNVYRYTETGTPGGINTDGISSKWYLKNYNITDKSKSTLNLTNLDISPYWIQKGIVSATNSSVIIITEFETFIYNYNDNEYLQLQSDNEIYDAQFLSDNKSIVIYRGFLSYSLNLYDIENQQISKLITLDHYYNRFSGLYTNNPIFFLLMGDTLTYVNTHDKSFTHFSINTNYAILYDIDKVAAHENGEINFYSILGDSLQKENSVTLIESNLENFSISSSLDFIVYQTRNKIVLKNMHSGEEEVLYKNKHKQK